LLLVQAGVLEAVGMIAAGHFSVCGFDLVVGAGGGDAEEVAGGLEGKRKGGWSGRLRIFWEEFRFL